MDIILFLLYCLCWIISVCQATEAPSMDSTQIVMDGTRADISPMDIRTNTDTKHNEHDGSILLASLSWLPWSIELDVVFITLIGLFIICLCCCCFCHYHWYLENEKLKIQVIDARNKTEIKIVRPETPSFGRSPSLKHRIPSMTSNNEDSYLYDEEHEPSSNRLFGMFGAKMKPLQDADDDEDEANSDDEQLGLNKDVV